MQNCMCIEGPLCFAAGTATPIPSEAGCGDVLQSAHMCVLCRKASHLCAIHLMGWSEGGFHRLPA